MFDYVNMEGFIITYINFKVVMDPSMFRTKKGWFPCTAATSMMDINKFPSVLLVLIALIIAFPHLFSSVMIGL